MISFIVSVTGWLYGIDYTDYLPAGSASSQYSAEDEIGQYNYGYNSSDQSKSGVKTTGVVVRRNGLVQTANLFLML